MDHVESSGGNGGICVYKDGGGTVHVPNQSHLEDTLQDWRPGNQRESPLYASIFFESANVLALKPRVWRRVQLSFSAK